MYRHILLVALSGCLRLAAAQIQQQQNPLALAHSTLAMSEQEYQTHDTEQGQQSTQQEQEDDDNSPMIYKTPRDYASWARQYRAALEAEGKEVVFMSELCTLIPRREGESADDYAKRYSNGMNDMISRGVSILGDTITHDVVASGFYVDGHQFDLGPGSGCTKKEFREFGELLASKGVQYADIPERFLKFEVDRASQQP